ncbi:MAG: hypothetical protein M0Z95_19445 [Actinomycetota bacterium]|jgi:hypothetical protein|nr:hypothetical protein [Actinomycetota bacterium]
MTHALGATIGVERQWRQSMAGLSQSHSADEQHCKIFGQRFQRRHAPAAIP